LATSVYDIVEFELQDGQVVEIRPLNIKRLRKFMEVVGKISDVKPDDQDGQLDAMLEACSIILEGKVSGADNVDVLADLLDLPTMNRIMEVAGGVSVNSPNPTVG